ncbi:MAG: 3'(2'),5'-bisphosphate nucleotidase CysQ [Oceanicoccus sp.]
MDNWSGSEYSMDKRGLAEKLAALCAEAGVAIVEIYNSTQPVDVEYKSDASPLTEADKRAHDIIVSGLHAMTPAWPILSEEQDLPDFERRNNWGTYWLVDPMDGTREFVERTGQFTVNVALIEQGVATLGVVYLPVEKTAYIGIPEQAFAVKVDNGKTTPLRVSTVQRSVPVTVLSSSRYQGGNLECCMLRLTTHFGDIERLQAGSALKFCYLAEGRGDIYPRFSPCCEWDTAAGQAVLEGAGGSLVDLDFNPLRYNQQQSVMSPNFYGLGRTGTNWKEILS